MANVIEDKVYSEFWSDKYTVESTADLHPDEYQSVLDIFEESVKKYADKPAFANLDYQMTYGELDTLTRDFAAWLQKHTSLQKGDRVAVMMPNILQYPVAAFGVMRAGMVLVNTNPLYTVEELTHQFNDSGAKGLVMLENMGDVVEKALPRTGVKHIVTTAVGDLVPAPKRWMVNFVIRKVKKMVPAHNLPTAVPLRTALKKGAGSALTPAGFKPDDLAVLQYTGGTTGVAKGAMLSHGNLVANMIQMKESIRDMLREGEDIAITPLPMYHIYCFTCNCLAMMSTGNLSVLITNPRDIPGFIKELKKWKFTGFAGLNTLFVALANQPGFKDLDFSELRFTVSGGMALTKDAADTWEGITGCKISEGYGLTEASPVLTTNPVSDNRLGTIGRPVPGTIIKVVDDEGNDVPPGDGEKRGELLAKGPQIMQGYWQRPEETGRTVTADGWLKTGDIATIDQDGYIRIVDRKKDMILVSGFNVYPNELEDVLVSHPKVTECAAIGIPDDTTGEQIKMFVVRNDASLSEDEVREYCRKSMTAYKIPRMVEFRDELPKTPVGKILRRELRDESPH